MENCDARRGSGLAFPWSIVSPCMSSVSQAIRPRVMTGRALCESPSFPSSRCSRAGTGIRARNPDLEASRRDDGWRAAGNDADSHSACLETHPSHAPAHRRHDAPGRCRATGPAAHERRVARAFAQRPRRRLVRHSVLAPQELEIERGIVLASRLSAVQLISSQRIFALSSVVEVG